MARAKQTLRDVAKKFFDSPEFYRTKEGTQHDYRRFITVMLADVGDIPTYRLKMHTSYG